MSKRIVKVLSDVQKTEIQTRFANGEKNKSALAREFGVSARTVGRVIDETPVKVDTVVGFKVGDIIKGSPDSLYFVTSEDSICKVVKLLGKGEGCTYDDIEVELISHSNEWFKKEIGFTFSVESEYFELVNNPFGEVDETEVVEEPTDVAHIVTDMAITLSVNGNIQLIDFSHPSFEATKVAITEGRFNDAVALMDIKKAIEHFSEGALKVEMGKVTYRGVPVENGLTNKIIDLMGNGDEGFKGFALFMEKVMQNPSKQTRERLMEFAAAEDIGISLDGDLICFKNVKDDFKPSRSGAWVRYEDGEWSYDSSAFYTNRVNDVCEMPREEVDDIESNTCSVGLHVCSVHYLKAMWGTNGRTMKVHVDPRDMVAIPPDYNNSKARVSRYTVVEDVTDSLDTYLDKVQ